MRWRLLDGGMASGPWNMGVDEALLASAASGVATLRLYSWRGAWLSLGYAQDLEADQVARCRRAGVGLVRRATGGRAVLHGRDLTYAVAAPEGWLPRGLRGSYDLVAAALLDALRKLGLDAVRSPRGSEAPGRGVFDCFAAPAADEICVAGRKLAGSAQRRTGGVVLQHGSIRMAPDSRFVTRALGLTEAAATSLEEQGCRASEAELRAACRSAFASALQAELELGSLSPAERRLAGRRLDAHARRPLARPALALKASRGASASQGVFSRVHLYDR